MASVLLDTGPLVALFKRNDAHHAGTAAWLKRHRGPLLTTHAVLTETWHLLSPTARLPMMRFVAAAVDTCDLGENAVSAINALLEQYADLPMDYADATLLVLAEARNVYSIATIDVMDFSVYRLRSGSAMKLVL